MKIFILFICIFAILWFFNQQKEGFQLIVNPKGNFNPFKTLPDQMITWKPYALPGHANYSAYFYQNPYMYPVY